RKQKNQHYLRKQKMAASRFLNVSCRGMMFNLLILLV
ncbi:FHIPEP family protein, partial [Vibrio parahaemolyticus V-223/04]